VNLDRRSVPYRIFENGLRIVGVIVFSAFASSSNGMNMRSFLLFFLGGLALVVGWQIAYVRRYEYRVTADTFDIRSGVFSRREREIPFERIQNVDIAQNVVQRALDIAELRLETAGGNASEATLRYVSREEASRLQELISDRKRDETTPETAEETGGDVLFELDGRELTVLGVTSANFRLLGLILVGLSFLGSPVAAREVSPRVGLLLLLGPAFAVVGLVVLWIVSGVQAVFRYYDFRLSHHGEELRYRRGLLQQYNGTIPLSKIQTLMIRENVLARAAGYGSLVIETAGYAPGQGGSSVESAVPIAKRDRVIELAQTIEDVGEFPFTRPPRRARMRYLARYTIVVAVLTGLLYGVHVVTGELPQWYLGAATWLLVPIGAHLKWSHLGYYVDEDYVVTRSGFWTRRTTIVPVYRVQTVSNSQTVFQRRRDLGTLVVDTATSGGFWGGNAVALDIDIETARTLRRRVHSRFQQSLRDRRDRLRREREHGRGQSLG
jgi:putative membrane protein